VALAPLVPAVEQSLIGTLPARYPRADPGRRLGGVERRGTPTRWREAYRAHPGDLDVAVLYADALMNIAPWALWDQATGEPSFAGHHAGAVGARPGAGDPGGPGTPRARCTCTST